MVSRNGHKQVGDTGVSVATSHRTLYKLVSLSMSVNVTLGWAHCTTLTTLCHSKGLQPAHTFQGLLGA